MIEFFVAGVPIPQGSKTIAQAGGKVWLRDANARDLRAWRDRVAAVARGEVTEPLEEGVVVRLWFYLPRPKTVKRLLPWVKPDIDKLCRAVNDSLTTAGVWHDDSQVVELYASKAYSERPGVLIEIREAS